MRIQRWGGHSVPILEQPLRWDRSTSARSAVLMVADEGMVETEAQRQEFFREVYGGSRFGPIGGGDNAPYVTAAVTAIANAANLTGTTRALLPGSVSPAFAGGPTGSGVGGFWYPGRAVRVTIWGVMTTPASGATTFTSDWTVTTTSATTLGNTLGASAASATVVASQTNATWKLNGQVTCRTVGSSGTVFGQGDFQPSSVLWTTQTELFMPNTAPAAATVDTSAASSWINFAGTLAGSASWTMAVTQAIWETLN